VIAPAQAIAAPSTARDVVSLSKPGIVLMTALTAAGGLGLAPVNPSLRLSLFTLAGTSLCVASANAFNMVLERDGDRCMARTRTRPLPSGRMTTSAAITVGVVLGLAGLALLLIAVNPLTALLGAFGLLVYVLAYTPLKRITPHALFAGCVAGAMPPVMGWSAATGSIATPGLALFLVLFTWQIPHFLAISLYRKDDYERAGILAAPIVWGDEPVRKLIAVSSAALLLVSLGPFVIGMAGPVYLVTAVTAGVWITWCSIDQPGNATEWARGIFRVSLIYLPALATGMIVDALVS